MAGNFVATVKDSLSSISESFSSAATLLSGGTIKDKGDSPLLTSFELSTQGTDRDVNSLWKIDGENWDKVFAYRFVIVREKGEPISFVLPIPPQTMMIKPVLPNQVTPTFGGVTEENSAVKFWLMNMTGTMGTAVGRKINDEGTRENTAEKFREVMETTGLLAGTFSGTKQLLGKVASIESAIIDENPIGALNNAMLPSLPFSGSAVNAKSNGFKESKELEKFLYMYQTVKARDPNGYSLYFISHKTDQAWRVAVKDFQLQQNAQSPNLFRYSMSLQGWDCTNVQSVLTKTDVSRDYDRFGIGGDLAGVNTLDTISSLSKYKPQNDKLRAIRRSLGFS